MTLKQKAWSLTVLVLVFLLGTMLVGLYVLRTASNTDNHARITQLVKTTYNTIVQLENVAASGKMSEADAKAVATQILRENKYHDSEYVYVTDDKLLFVAAPLDPQLHGTSFNDFKDSKGNSVGAIAAAALDKSGGGLTEYWWDSKRDGKVVDLLSVAVRTPKWGWVVGSGISFAEADARFWSNARWQVIVCLVLAAIIGAVLIYAVRQLVQTLGGEPDQVVKLVSRVASGDLVQTGGPRARQGSILGEVERMQSTLGGVMSEIARDARQLEQHASQIATSSREISVAAGRQTDSTSTMAAAMEELTVSINHISDNTGDAEKTSRMATELAGEGVGQVNLASSSMGHIADSVARASGQIRDLDAKARQISSIAAVIKEIAGQTNLLALNAAIEAARAGEQGRGFAVVADEVRKLAERTSSATVDIEKMLTAVQSETDSVVTVMDEALPQVQHGVELAQHVAESLQRIHGGAEATLARLNEMATATREQSEASNSIAGRVEEISQMVEETTASIHRATDTAGEIELVAQRLNQMVGKFRL
ncbi:methyl-accepting chemotaxis protein [Amantichitinum ursilacus]|uniref:Methyl-accepting chemotaxis protein 4 n=1 Tax=Amantichitinum ursilacus TaxID=857265 RepID=A0A0N0GPW4_9NEIS|nr:methyl-accepting chemotaxis protein [Amantichitinum ursilacus]KPC53882.1 Methyl-accepting chemotaxis protein 4 [Amantichitinum ursilacus]